jgi:hypothetical protein
MIEEQWGELCKARQDEARQDKTSTRQLHDKCNYETTTRQVQLQDDYKTRQRKDHHKTIIRQGNHKTITRQSQDKIRQQNTRPDNRKTKQDQAMAEHG